MSSIFTYRKVYGKYMKRKKSPSRNPSLRAKLKRAGVRLVHGYETVRRKKRK